MAELAHRAVRTVQQQPEVVHDRLLELAARLRDELPPIPAGSQAASILGISGRLALNVVDRGPNRIELATTDGRIRAQGSADLEPTADGRTTVTMEIAIKPQGMAANLMLGAALAARPDIRRQVVDGLEAGLDDLTLELAKPDAEWDASRWQPPGVPSRH